MKNILAFFFLLAFSHSYSQIKVNNDSLSESDGLILYNGKPFTGISIKINEYTSFKEIIETSYKVGIKNGPFLNNVLHRDSLNKILIEKGNYLNSKLDGEFERYSWSGKTELKCKYKNGQYDGLYEEYSDKGVMKIKCTYINGKLDGLFEEYDQTDGKLWKKFTYTLGTWNGPFEIYDFEDGLLMERGIYKMGEYDGLHEFFYTGNVYDHSGLPKQKINYKDGKYHGEYIDYFEDGKIETRKNYIMGQENGLYENYRNEDEKYFLFKKCYYKMGKYDGLYEEYDFSNGILVKKCNYKMGEYDGLYEEYESDGRLKKKGKYVNGVFSFD